MVYQSTKACELRELRTEIARIELMLLDIKEYIKKSQSSNFQCEIIRFLRDIFEFVKVEYQKYVQSHRGDVYFG